jgi:hypothetical protein
LAKFAHVGKFAKGVVDPRITMAPESPSLCDAADLGKNEWKVICVVPVIERFAIIRIGNY